MRNLNRLCVALIPLCIIAAVCIGVQPSHAEPYTNLSHGISIEFPVGWRLKSSTIQNVLIKSRRPSDLLAFMSLSSYELDEELSLSDASPNELLQMSLGFNDNVDAVLIKSGSLTIGNAQAPWIKYDVRAPALASGYGFDCYVVRGKTLFKIGGRTDRDLAWFERNEPLFIQACRSILFLQQNAHTTGQVSLTQYADAKHGFRLSHPSDWTVKEAMTKATVFKAVKKFADGQYLMFTVNVQLLDRNVNSMTDFTIDDITDFTKQMYGVNNVSVLDSGRGQVGEEPCIRLLLDARPPIIQPRVEYTTYVIRNRYLYNVTVSCDKPLYPQYGQHIKQLGDTFIFASPSRPATSGAPSQRTYAPKRFRRVYKAPGEKPIPAFLKTFGERWLTYLMIAIVFAAGAAIWAKIKGKKKTETPNNSVDSDKE